MSLLLLVGPPGAGKTAFAIDRLERAATQGQASFTIMSADVARSSQAEKHLRNGRFASRDRRSWSLQASGPGIAPTTLELGREDSVGAVHRRLADVVAAYRMVSARVGGPPARIDARYANGIAASSPSSSTVPKAR